MAVRAKNLQPAKQAAKANSTVTPKKSSKKK